MVMMDLKFGNAKRPSDAEIVAKIFFCGLLCYVAVFFLFALIGRPFDSVDLSKANDRYVVTADNFDELVAGAVLGFLFGVAWVFIRNKGLDFVLAHRIGMTRRSGELDVWDRTFSRLRSNQAFVNIRDPDGSIIQGVVRNFSDSGAPRELHLDDVVFFDNDRNIIRTASSVLLSFPSDKIMIEFNLKPEDDDGDNHNASDKQLGEANGNYPDNAAKATGTSSTITEASKQVEFPTASQARKTRRPKSGRRPRGRT